MSKYGPPLKMHEEQLEMLRILLPFMAELARENSAKMAAKRSK